MRVAGCSRKWVLAVAAVVSSACGQAARVSAPAAQGVAVSVQPSAVQTAPGTTVPFTATVTGTLVVGVSWRVTEANGGSIDAGGVYSAPSAPGTFHVVATSSADSTRSATAVVTVTPTPVVAVTVTPPSAVTTVGGPVNFTALVTGTTAGQPTGVTWRVQEAGGGTIDAAGRYLAPATPGDYHVVATSQADSTKSSTATVTVIAADTGIDMAIVPADRRTVWNPGVPGGIPNFPNTITVDAARFGDGVTDATAAIRAAVASAQAAATPTSPQVVYLPAGVYLLSDSITVTKSYVVIRGAGPRKTYLRQRPLFSGVIEIETPDPEFQYGTPIDVVADVPKGALSITVADASAIQVGDVLQIDQLDPDGSTPGGTGSDFGPNGWVWRNGTDWTNRTPTNRAGSSQQGPLSPLGIRSIMQMIEVESKSGNTLRLKSPVHMEYPLARRPQVFWRVGARSGKPGTKYNGVEELTVQGGRDRHVAFRNAAYSWIRNVESDGTVNLWYGTHFTLTACYRCVIRDSYVHHSDSTSPGHDSDPYGAAGRAYGILMQTAVTDSLIENNIVMYQNKPIITMTAGGGNVVAYNYVDNTTFVQGWTSPDWQETAIDTNHGCFSHYMLVEGNLTPNIASDSTHGNSGFHVFFRNRATGQNSSRTTSGPLRAISIDAYSREHTSIGNVLFSSYLNGYQGKPGVVLNGHLTRSDSHDVYQIGNFAWDQVTGAAPNWGDWEPRRNNRYDAAGPFLAEDLFHRHMDFDYVSNSVYRNPANPVTALPPSLYLKSKPAFFGDNPWPWVDPEGATKAYTLPAKARFDAGNP